MQSLQTTPAGSVSRGVRHDAPSAPTHQNGTPKRLAARDRREVDTLSTEDLLELCRQGDTAAVRVLLGRFERPIFHLAFRLAGNYDDAHDVAAEAFLRICQVIHTCKSAVTLPAWINRIVANVFYDIRRRAQRAPAVSLDALMERTNGSFLAAKEAVPTSPQMCVEEQERRTILDGAIADLPNYQRKMVRLFYQEDRSYGEIADIMGIPVGTVKSRLSRARLALQQRLEPYRGALVS